MVKTCKTATTLLGHNGLLIRCDDLLTRNFLWTL
ncbi:unnamed protein product [Nezara viridula]|uniref:Uncharacterized protein n=1 Tax=Nezara viridula TaxID=85310 RepID=A0A9P0HGY8_NEZVI|nr:unnamed protein product [Nezara viridula]